MSPKPSRSAAQPAKKAAYNPSDASQKQGFSAPQSMIDLAKSRAKETHGGNLSLYLQSLIESDIKGGSSASIKNPAHNGITHEQYMRGCIIQGLLASGRFIEETEDGPWPIISKIEIFDQDGAEFDPPDYRYEAAVVEAMLCIMLGINKNKELNPAR